MLVYENVCVGAWGDSPISTESVESWAREVMHMSPARAGRERRIAMRSSQPL